jgi:hypothetical protein
VARVTKLTAMDLKCVALMGMTMTVVLYFDACSFVMASRAGLNRPS